MTSIRTKLLLLNASAVLGTILGSILVVAYLSADITKAVAGIVSQGQAEVYSQRLAGIQAMIESSFKSLHTTLKETGLENTDMGKTYETEAKEGILAKLREMYYARDKPAEGAYPFIVDDHARIVLHPKLNKDDDSLAQMGFPAELNQNRDAGFLFHNLSAWIYTQRFEPWGWTIVYQVPESIRSRELNKVARLLSGLRGQLAIVITLIGGLVIWILARFITRFITRPLSAVIRGLNNSSSLVASAAALVSATSQKMAQSATNQASTVEEISGSLQEINAMTQNNADCASGADQLARQAVQGVEEGNAAVQQLQAAMAAINESAATISKITRNIEEIAFQTNLLSLNAAVEAARAGESGKGFAVVADEVRNLAHRAADSAKETTRLIEDSSGKTQAGTEIMSRTRQALERIKDNSKKVADIISTIANVSRDQAAGIEQISTSINQINQAAQQTSSSAEESTSSSKTLALQAESLREMIVMLETLVGSSDRGAHGIRR